MRDVIEMAREAGGRAQQNKNCDVEYLMSADALKAFAYFARADEREARAELDATNKQVEILSDALAESRREVAALVQPVAWLENLKRLASICPELNMVNYSEEDVDDLNCWAIEVATCIDSITTLAAHGIKGNT